MPWELTGNPLTNPSTDYLGTTDSQPLVIKTNGLERMHISTDGNVGIGTTRPQEKLTVDPQGPGGIVIGYSPSTGVDGFTSLILTISAQKGGFAQIQAIKASGTEWGDIALNPDGGHIGIGTPSPQKPLDVAASGGIRISQSGSLSSDNELYFQDNGQIRSLDDNHRIIFDRANNILELREFGDVIFSTGATSGTRTQTVTFSSNGNVGIGTATPNAKLSVSGDISVTGDVILTGADCAEEFDIAEGAETVPGIVMVLDQSGRLQPCRNACDKRVAGVISGAGEYQPGLILDRQQSRENRMPLALVGKVYCKVDAQYGPIEVGDLLTTSPTPGHAMKANDPLKAFGAVLGKALQGLQKGQALLPILVALQ